MKTVLAFFTFNALLSAIATTVDLYCF